MTDSYSLDPEEVLAASRVMRRAYEIYKKECATSGLIPHGVKRWQYFARLRYSINVGPFGTEQEIPE